MSVTTKPCGRRDCKARIEIQGRHCSRGIANFKSVVELCKDCAEVYCPECCGNLTWRQIVIEKKSGSSERFERPVNCDRCAKTGKLTERQLAQRAADKRHRNHFDACDVCSKHPALIAREQFDVYVGKNRIGSGSKNVYAPRETCEEGKAISSVLLSLGAAIDADGYFWGWDGLDARGEPIRWLDPNYREVVTSRHTLGEADQGHDTEDEDDLVVSEEDVHG